MARGKLKVGDWVSLDSKTDGYYWMHHKVCDCDGNIISPLFSRVFFFS